MDKQKESLELKKLYLVQTDGFQNKLFFSMMTLSFSLVLYSLKSEISSYWAYLSIILALLVAILYLFFQKSRKKSFNKIISDINRLSLLKKIK